jgi:hypothetical protein
MAEPTNPQAKRALKSFHEQAAKLGGLAPTTTKAMYQTNLTGLENHLVRVRAARLRTELHLTAIYSFFLNLRSRSQRPSRHLRRPISSRR